MIIVAERKKEIDEERERKKENDLPHDGEKDRHQVEKWKKRV